MSPCRGHLPDDNHPTSRPPLRSSMEGTFVVQAIPLACCRTSFGPEARNLLKNRKNKCFGLARPLSGKWGQTAEKLEKMVPNSYSSADFPIFRLFLSYFPGEGLGRPKPIYFCFFFFSISGVGPKPIL